MELFIPEVLKITLILSGMLNELRSFLAFIRSSPSNLLEIPPAFGFLGRRTKYLPANLRYVLNAAPFVPRSSLSTGTIISLPLSMQSLDDFDFPCVKISEAISLNGRNPWRVLPKFTKAASSPGSTLDIIPL